MRFGTRSEWREAGLELARVVTPASVMRGLGEFVVGLACLVGTIWATREVAVEYGTWPATVTALALFAVSAVVIEALEEHGWSWVWPALKWTAYAVLAVALGTVCVVFLGPEATLAAAVGIGLSRWLESWMRDAKGPKP